MPSETVQLMPDEVASERNFTHPGHTLADQQTMQYMVRQLCLTLEYRHFKLPPPHTVYFNCPDNLVWFYRMVIARPNELCQMRPLTFVGFFGDRRADGDVELIDEFDSMLVAEIPEHAGLLCYNTMAVAGGNYGNLVIFTDNAARDHWSTSQAHARAAGVLAPNYYRTVRIYNGVLPHGVLDEKSLKLVRVKYYDYMSDPAWRAVREL